GKQRSGHSHPTGNPAAHAHPLRHHLARDHPSHHRLARGHLARDRPGPCQHSTEYACAHPTGSCSRARPTHQGVVDNPARAPSRTTPRGTNTPPAAKSPLAPTTAPLPRPLHRCPDHSTAAPTTAPPPPIHTVGPVTNQPLGIRAEVRIR